eukprot:CAMPEP_0115319610 /NCGR_PEP_ID=MMETSP0270-20121206/79861_1 /TAXON_ID=71861 /ORGANISM="Scrippsiella trochoidea, Strain CCMP3099" /LENGTH=305 /DNA_ID=CAMNT_0002739321 /DNA_START=11 /DNA_END=925 /DNA_ORIENTATION=+
MFQPQREESCWKSIIWRGTFIDIQEQGAHTLRRTLSDPSLSNDRSLHVSVFGNEVAYVQKLAGRVADSWGKVCSRDLKHHSSSDSIEEDTTSVGSVESPTTTSDTDAFLTSSVACASPLCSPTANFTSPTFGNSLARVLSATAVGKVEHMPQQILQCMSTSGSEKQDCDTFATECSPRGGHADLMSGDAEGAQAQAHKTAACNPGSVGHPTLCLRPCLHFAAGKCKNGDSCSFCHLSHPKRPASLDKQQRQVLQEMSVVQQSAALVLPVLKQKLTAVDTSQETVALFAEIATACGVAELVRDDIG